MSPIVKPGDRIRLLEMPSDPDPIPVESTGTVLSATEGLLAQIQVQWDNLRTLALIPGVDSWEIVGHSDLVAPALGCPKCGNLAMDLLDWNSDCTLVTCALCGTSYEP